MLEKIRQSFQNGSLLVKSMDRGSGAVEWSPIRDVMKHNSRGKRILKVHSGEMSVVVTEDHSLFDEFGEEVRGSSLKPGSKILVDGGGVVESRTVTGVDEKGPRQAMFDVSVPDNENFVLSSGIVAHNSYSISGVSLDIEKSSKYQAMKDEFINEYDKLVEANKRSVKIIKGLVQPRYGIGITSALGPYNTVGAQSRRNWISPTRPAWA